MGSQVKFDPGVHGFQIKENCIFSHLSMDYGRKKNEICIAKAKMKKVSIIVASKTPWHKTHVLENAQFLDLLTIWVFFSYKENKNLITKFASFPSFLALLFIYIAQF